MRLRVFVGVRVFVEVFVRNSVRSGCRYTVVRNRIRRYGKQWYVMYNKRYVSITHYGVLGLSI